MWQLIFVLAVLGLVLVVFTPVGNTLLQLGAHKIYRHLPQGFIDAVVIPALVYYKVFLGSLICRETLAPQDSPANIRRLLHDNISCPCGKHQGNGRRLWVQQGPGGIELIFIEEVVEGVNKDSESSAPSAQGLNAARGAWGEKLVPSEGGRKKKSRNKKRLRVKV